MSSLILNHRYRFLFIKTRKTAGSSVEIGLSRVCEPGDIVTPLGERLGEEDQRRAEGGFGPSGWAKTVWQHRGVREWRRLIWKGRRANYYPTHGTAEQIRRLVGEEVWNDYFKFTIERNPWDRAVSRYWWQQYRWQRRGKRGFDDIGECLEYLARTKPFWLSNWDHYAIDDRIVVDRVLFYEDLASEIEDLRRGLGIEGDISLPGKRAKGTHRPPGSSYREMLDDEARDLVARVCAREIEAFGYEF